MSPSNFGLRSTDLWHARRLFGPKARAEGRTEAALTTLGLHGDGFDLKATRAALSTLVQLTKANGDVQPLDLEVVSQRLSADAAASLKAMFQAVHELKARGTLTKNPRVDTVELVAVRRLEAGTLPKPLVSKLRRTAGLELYRLYADPLRDDGLHQALGHYLARRHRVGEPTLLEAEVPPRLTLREEAARKEAATLALLGDSGLPLPVRLELIERMGTFGGPEALASLTPLAAGGGPLAKAAKAAGREIRHAQKMTIVLAAMEVKPYCGTGGLSNVMAESARALAKKGHRVVVLTPRHEIIDPARLTDTDRGGVVLGPTGPAGFGLKKDVRDGVEFWFIESDQYFSKDRPGIYGGPGDYQDNADRFDFFGAAIPQAVKAILGTKVPDVIHLNDAHTAAGALYQKLDPSFAKTACVLQVHNLGGAYQGRFNAEDHLHRLRFAGLGLHYPMGPSEFHGDVSFLKLGMHQADAALTVSRQYKDEILTEELGEGLHGVLRSLDARGRLHGSLNGIDPEVWNSEKDPLISHPFSFADRAGKAACKAELLRRFGLPELAGSPVFGVVARLTEQKGFDDIVRSIDQALGAGKPGQYVVLGDGDPAIRRQIVELGARYPGRVAIAEKFSTALEHQIYAGSDFFLMPSKFEPCGLPQMYSLRYLTIPIVRAVGGLEESIQDFDPATKEGNGFKFQDDLSGAIDRALTWYQGDAPEKEPLLRNAALSDFSWDGSAAPELLAFYRKVLAEGPAAPHRKRARDERGAA